MRKIVSALLGLMLASSFAYAQADTIFLYHGRKLMPQEGNGVQGVRSLFFRLSGTAPARGKCRRDLAIVELSDGVYSLRQAFEQGFTESADSKVEVCSDAVSGQLTETLYVNMVYYSGGNLQAGYAWQSSNPPQGKIADTVTSYENIEYHMSGTKRPGRLRDYMKN